MATQGRDGAVKQGTTAEGTAKGESPDPMGRWLGVCWTVGAAIYGWLALAVINEFDYVSMTLNSFLQCWVIVPLAVLGAGLFFVLLGKPRRLFVEKKGSGSFLSRIFRSLLPIFFCFSALAVLVLTLMTYNGEWADARQGVATIFASLFAAVGVVVSMIVSYRNGEETRKLEIQRQKKESQRHEDNRAMEARKQDAELIKTLNDRLHEVVPRRQGDDEGQRVASYYQLAALYKDWDNLAESSELVEKQRTNQQKYILKLFFGVVKGQGKQKRSGNKRARNKIFASTRTDWEIQTINSIIPDIFPAWSEENKDIEPEVIFELEGADLRELELYGLDLRRAKFSGANFEGSFLNESHFENASFIGAHLEGAKLGGAHFEGANLAGSHLGGASLAMAHLEKSILFSADLEGSILMGAHFSKAQFFITTQNIDLKVLYPDVIKQLSVANYLDAGRLLEADGFDQELVDEIMAAYRKRQKGVKRKFRIARGSSHK